MKQPTIFIKIMFGCSITSVILFSVFYIWGLYNCSDFYALLDCTLPFFFSSVFSVIGFGYAQYRYSVENDAAEVHKHAHEKMHTKDKSKNYERRYIIKTYGRNGSYKTKQINMRGDYGLLKSA